MKAESGLTAIEKNEPPTTTDLFAGGSRHIGWRSNCSDIRTLFKVESRDIRTFALPNGSLRRRF